MGRNTRDKNKGVLKINTDTRRDGRALTSPGRVADVRTGVAAMTRKRCFDKPDYHSNAGDVGCTGSRRIPVLG